MRLVAFSVHSGALSVFGPVTLSVRSVALGAVRLVCRSLGGVFGYLLWSELPDLQSTIGICIIAAAGLYTLHRELVNARRSK